MHEKEGGLEIAATMPAVAATEADARRGQTLFVAKGCVACHQHSAVERDSNTPAIGPNLTYYAKGSAEFLRQWLRDPAAIRPGTQMPNLNLSEEEIAALVAFILTAAQDDSDPFTEPPSPKGDSMATAAAPAKASDTAALTQRGGCDASLIEARAFRMVQLTHLDQHEFRPIDPCTGDDLLQSPLRLDGLSGGHAVAPDGRTLITIANHEVSCDLNCYPREATLHFIDLAHGEVSASTISFPTWINGFAFTPDGAELALSYDARQQRPSSGSEPVALEYTLLVVDVARRAVVRQTSLHFVPTRMAYTPDGRSLLVYGIEYGLSSGVNPRVRVALIDSRDLKVEWELPLPGVRDGYYRSEGEEVWWAPALVFDVSSLYIVHADADELTTVDFARRNTRTVAIEPARSWLERLVLLTAAEAHAKALNGTSKQAVLSADGRRLYVVGRTSTATESEARWRHSTETSLGLKVVDVSNGREISHLATDATGIEWSAEALLFTTLKPGQKLLGPISDN